MFFVGVLIDKWQSAIWNNTNSKNVLEWLDLKMENLQWHCFLLAHWLKQQKYFTWRQKLSVWAVKFKFTHGKSDFNIFNKQIREWIKWQSDGELI